MASHPSTGVTNQFSATAGKVGAWEEDRKSFFDAMRKNDTATADGIITKYPNEWKGWKSDQGLSPLNVAQDNNNLAVMSLLLDRGANIDERYKNGWFPIHLAFKNKQADIFDMLLERGAALDEKVVTKPAGEFSTACHSTLLHMAVAADDKNALVRLLEHGAKTDITVKFLDFSIPYIHTWFSYDSAGELATRKGKHLLGDIIGRASVLRADFLAAAAQPAPPPVPAPAPATPAENGKIDVMNPLQIKKQATP